eukprot:symbB.v1.2.016061.t1/scaffold1176.1/size133768/4
MSPFPMCLTIGRGCKFIQTLKCCQRAQRDRSRQDTIHSHGTLSAEDASWSARGFWAFFCRVLGFILGCFHVVKEENEGNVHASTEADDVRSARPNPPAGSLQRLPRFPWKKAVCRHQSLRTRCQPSGAQFFHTDLRNIGRGAMFFL